MGGLILKISTLVMDSGQVDLKDLNTSDGRWGGLVLKISTLVMDSG